MLRRLERVDDRNLIVGSATGDDAGVYRIARDRALVQTVDFFTPIVDDAGAYGRIAAANSLSDVYAMGGRPLTAMNILIVPQGVVSDAQIAAILRGGAAKVKEARCCLVGGHTIKGPEPVYGLSVTGMVDPRRVMTNAAARVGDVLVLTKPLGTGILTTGIKRGETSKRAAARAVRVMAALNSVGAEVAERGLAKAGTDVTGFGLLGHLAAMCRASGVSAEVFADEAPVIAPEVLELAGRGCVPGGTVSNMKVAEKVVEFAGVEEVRKTVLCDAQTSGGLLLCVRERRVGTVLELLKKRRTACAAVVGRVVRRAGALVRVS